MALVSTTKGDMDEALLEKREDVLDNANEFTRITEYWLQGELVHRSAHVTLKPKATVQAESVIKNFDEADKIAAQTGAPKFIQENKPGDLLK